MANVTDVLSQFPQSGAATGGSAFNIALYTLVSMVVLTGIVYALGKVISSRKFEDWAKNEFIQVLINAAIVGALFVLMNPGNGVIITVFNELVPSDAVVIPTIGLSSGIPVPETANITSTCTDDLPVTSGTALCFATNYLYALNTQIMNVVSTLFKITAVTDVLSKISVSIVIISLTPLSSLSIPTQILTVIIQSLVFLGIISSVEYALLVFANSVALTIFLPIGVVLRCFFGTRKLGGALIAFAVGIYLIFPLLLCLNAIAVNQANADVFANLASANTVLSVLNPFTTFTDLSDTSQSTVYLSNISAHGQEIVDTIQGLPSILVTYLALIVVQILILPIVAILLTSIAIKELAGLLGSEVHLERFGI